MEPLIKATPDVRTSLSSELIKYILVNQPPEVRPPLYIGHNFHSPMALYPKTKALWYEQTYQVSSQVNKKNSDGAQREGDRDSYEQEKWSDLGNIGGQGVSDGLLQVIEN